MRYGVTFNQLGQVIPPGLHIGVNHANLPYVPHPLMMTGHIPFVPVLGQANAPKSPLTAPTQAATAAANFGSYTGQ